MKTSQQKSNIARCDLLDSFYVRKDYANLKIVLETSDNDLELEILAQIYLMEQEYEKACKIFEKAGMRYEVGRCKLLEGKIEQTKEIWSKIETDSTLVHWGLSLLQFIDRYVYNPPTFFQIRSFLEVDLDALLKAKQYTYCENIINGADLMAKTNTECYKFIGRVFVNNNLHDMAKIFLQKAKDVCYVDPEVHYLLAKCYIAGNNIDSAQNSLQTCIDKAYGYYPARKLLQQLKLG